MLINLNETLLVGFPKQITADIEMDTFTIGKEKYVIKDKSAVDLTLTNLGNREIEIAGKFTVTLTIPCNRCAHDVFYKMDFDFVKNVDFNETSEDRLRNLDELNYINGYNLDLELLVYDELLVNFPMRVLCKEDCNGICKVCGTNLNNNQCQCDTTDIDPRMAIFRDILNNFKEV